MYYGAQYSSSSGRFLLTALIFSLVCLALVGWAPVSLSAFECTPEKAGYDFWNPQRFIAHAGGVIEGHIYTNSKEALERAYDNGFRLIELDLSKTSDGKLVAVHDWGHWKSVTGATSSPPPTAQQFLNAPIYSRFTPLTYADVVSFFRKKRDAVLVTDKTNEFSMLARTFPDPDRLLVEIFSWDDLKNAVAAGIKHPMPSFLWGKNALEQILKARRIYGVKFLAVHSSQVLMNPSLMSTLTSQGFCIFAYSSNSTDFVKDQIGGNRIFGIYTDYWEPKNSKFNCPTKEQCRTY